MHIDFRYHAFVKKKKSLNYFKITSINETHWCYVFKNHFFDILNDLNAFKENTKTIEGAEAKRLDLHFTQVEVIMIIVYLNGILLIVNHLIYNHLL